MNPDSKNKRQGRGRPRVAIQDRRSEILAAAVTPALRDEFHLICSEAGMTTSDYLRDVIVAFLETKRGERS